MKRLLTHAWLQWLCCWNYTLRGWGLAPDKWHWADLVLLNEGVLNRWMWFPFPAKKRPTK